MRKHILGATIFGFIFAVFAVPFTFFYAPPIPQVAEVRIENEGRPEIVSNGKTSCFGKREKDITYEIQSTQFDSDNDQFISKIYATWKGKVEPPKKLYVKTEVYTLKQNKTMPRLNSTVFDKPFESDKTATLVIKFKVPEYRDFDYKQNLYAIFKFAQSSNENINSFTNENVSNTQSVVYFHRTK